MASTSEAIFIIGGRTSYSTDSTTIAEYRDGSWSNVGDLKQNRLMHSSIVMGSKIMTVGGWTYSDANVGHVKKL